MARNPATFAKRQREMDKKRAQEEKRKKRAERKTNPDQKDEGGEETYERCMPILE